MSQLSVPADAPDRDADELAIAPPTGWNAQYIDGKWVQAESRDTIAVKNPSSGSEIGRIPIGTAGDVDAAYAAATRAQADWETTTAYERADIVNEAREILTSWTDELGYLFPAESGSVTTKARSELGGVEAIMQVSESLPFQMSGGQSQARFRERKRKSNKIRWVSSA